MVVLTEQQLSVGKRKIHNVKPQLKGGVQKHQFQVLVENVPRKQIVEVKLERPLIVGQLKTLIVTLVANVNIVALRTLVVNVLMMKPVVEKLENIQSV